MNFWNIFLDWLYPPCCVVCGSYAGGELLCPGCAQEMEQLREGTQELALDLMEQTGLQAVCAPFVYRGMVQKILPELKDRRDVRLTAFFAEEIVHTVLENGMECTAVTCVPMSRKKRRRRGFNHAEILAAAVAKKLGVPFLPGLLATRSSYRTQHSLNREERQHNAARNLYRTGRLCTGEAVLLIDDISTTGATLKTCAALLYQSGARKVLAATAALAPLKD